MRSITKTFWSGLISCALLRAGSEAQGPTPAVETADSASDESIQQQTQSSLKTALYFPDYLDGGVFSVKLAFSNVACYASAAAVVTAYTQDAQSLREMFDSETAFNISPMESSALEHRDGGISVGGGSRCRAILVP